MTSALGNNLLSSYGVFPFERQHPERSRRYQRRVGCACFNGCTFLCEKANLIQCLCSNLCTLLCENMYLSQYSCLNGWRIQILARSLCLGGWSCFNSCGSLSRYTWLNQCMCLGVPSCVIGWCIRCELLTTELDTSRLPCLLNFMQQPNETMYSSCCPWWWQRDVFYWISL